MGIINFMEHKLNARRALLVIFVLPLIVTAQTLDTLPTAKAGQQIILDKKITLPYGQSSLRLENVRKLVPNNNDSKKLDSLSVKMARGGDMSGGGSTLLFKNQRLFLDLFEEKYNQNLPSCIIDDPMNDTSLLSRINFENSCLNSSIIKALDRLLEFAPRLNQTIIAIYKNLPFYFSRGQFRILDTNFYLDPSKSFNDDMQISTAALYIRDVGVIFSFPQFRQLNQTHQSALVIHEVLRAMQIQYSLAMTNAEIQKIVAALFDENELALKNTLKNSNLVGFLKNEPNQDSLLKEIFLHYKILEKFNPQLSGAGVEQFKSILKSPSQNFWYDLSNILSQTSYEMLKYRIELKNSLSLSTTISLENLEMEFDQLVTQTRGKGMEHLYLNTLNKTAELTGFFMNIRGQPFEDCSSRAFNQSDCYQLSQILKNLIN